jgi:hypothetical protein
LVSALTEWGREGLWEGGGGNIRIDDSVWPRAAWVITVTASLGGVAVILVILKLWLSLVFLAGVFFVLNAVAVVLVRKADPDELKRRSAKSERLVQIVGRR